MKRLSLYRSLLHRPLYVIFVCHAASVFTEVAAVEKAEPARDNLIQKGLGLGCHQGLVARGELLLRELQIKFFRPRDLIKGEFGDGYGLHQLVKRHGQLPDGQLQVLAL